MRSDDLPYKLCGGNVSQKFPFNRIIRIICCFPYCLLQRVRLSTAGPFLKYTAGGRAIMPLSQKSFLKKAF